MKESFSRRDALSGLPLAQSGTTSYLTCMLRTGTVEGFVLLADRFGEIHKRVILFTAERGVISAIAHGALKTAGRLKPFTELFLYGRFSLYIDPVKESFKITDAECLNSFPGLRRSVRKLYAGSLFAEIVLKSFGGGEAGQELFRLFKQTMFLLNDASETDIDYLILQYIVKFLDLAGFGLRAEACTICGKTYGGKESAFFAKRIGGFVCRSCLSEDGVEFSPGAKIAYAHMLDAPSDSAARIRLSVHALAGFKNLLYFILQESLERELSTLATGKEFL